MTKITNDDVLKHPLIKEILKRKIAPESVVNRLVTEEVLEEGQKTTATNWMEKKLLSLRKQPDFNFEEWINSPLTRRSASRQMEKNGEPKLNDEDWKDSAAYVAHRYKKDTERQERERKQQTQAQAQANQQKKDQKPQQQPNQVGASEENLKKAQQLMKDPQYRGLLNSIAEMGDVAGVKGQLLIQSTALFLYYLIEEPQQKVNELQTDQFELVASSIGVDKSAATAAFMKATAEVGGKDVNKLREALRVVFANEKFVQQFKTSLKGKEKPEPQKQEKPQLEPPDEKESLPGDLPSGRDRVPVGRDVTEPQSDADMEKEKEEVEKTVEQVTSPENLKKEFEDKSKAVTPERFDKSYIETLDIFFGQTDKASFMKQILLKNQVKMLGGMISTLKKILDQETGEKGEKGAERRAYTNIDEQYPANASPEEIKKVEDEMSEFDIDDGKKEVIPLTDKQKVSLKRQLRAMADILVKSKKIADSYNTYGSKKSYDPQFDGSSLEKALQDILVHVQMHNARLVYTMRDIVEGYEKEAQTQKINEREESSLSRKDKIDRIRDVFNDMGEMYVNSLRVSLGGDAEGTEYQQERAKAKSTAQNILKKAEEIVPFFPKMKVHSDGRIVSLGQGIEALDARIKDYKRILRDVYDTTKDDLIAPAHISEMYESIKITCQTIQDQFDVKCAIRDKDIQFLNKTLPKPRPALVTPQPESTDTGSGEPEKKEVPKSLPGDERTPSLPAGEKKPSLPAGEKKPSIDPGPEKKGLPGELPSDVEEEKPQYTLADNYDDSDLRKSWNSSNRDKGFNFDNDLKSWINFFGPYIPKGILREKKSANTPVGKMVDTATFAKHKDEILQKFKKLQNSDPKEAASIDRISKALNKGKSGPGVTKKFSKLVRGIRKPKEPESKKDIEESLIKKLIPIVNNLYRGKNG